MAKELGKYYGFETNELAFGNGSDDLIGVLVRLFCEPGDSILTSESSFLFYKVAAKAARVNCIETPMAEGLKFDLDALLKEARQKKPKLIFIANPNNPTGSYLSGHELDQFMSSLSSEKETLVVLDEAYNEFVRAEDFANSKELFAKYDNLVILRTLSKVFGLAGLRFGVVVAKPQIISYLNRIRSPFNVNAIAQEAAIAAVNETAYLQRSQRVNWDGLDYFYEQLQSMGLKYWPSQANFVLFDSQREADSVFQDLLRKGVILRPMANYGLKTCLRMSVGLPEENRIAIKALQSVLS